MFSNLLTEKTCIDGLNDNTIAAVCACHFLRGMFRPGSEGQYWHMCQLRFLPKHGNDCLTVDIWQP